MNKIKLNDKYLFYFTENIICDKSITIKGKQVDTQHDDYHNVISIKSILGDQDHVNYTMYNDDNEPIYEYVFGSIEIKRTTDIHSNDDFVDFEIILLDEITHGTHMKLSKGGKLITDPTKIRLEATDIKQTVEYKTLDHMFKKLKWDNGTWV